MTIAQRVLAAALLPLLPVLAACSASVSTGSGYDADAVAEQVQEAQEEATPDLDVTDPSCPDSEPEEGGTIECTIAIDGVEAPYTVTFTEVTDDGVDFDIEPAQAIISVASTVELYQAELEKQGYTDVEVDCGDAGVVVQDPGTTFTCELTQDGSTFEREVTIDDIDGNVTIEY